MFLFQEMEILVLALYFSLGFLPYWTYVNLPFCLFSVTVHIMPNYTSYSCLLFCVPAVAKTNYKLKRKK